jgi:hypothetical protein
MLLKKKVVFGAKTVAPQPPAPATATEGSIPLKKTTAAPVPVPVAAAPTEEKKAEVSTTPTTPVKTTTTAAPAAPDVKLKNKKTSVAAKRKADKLKKLKAKEEDASDGDEEDDEADQPPKKKAKTKATAAAVSVSTGIRDRCRAMLKEYEKSTAVVQIPSVIQLAAEVVVGMNTDTVKEIKMHKSGSSMTEMLNPAVYQYCMMYIQARAASKDDHDDITTALTDAYKKNFIAGQEEALRNILESKRPSVDKTIETLADVVSKHKWNAMTIDGCMLDPTTRQMFMDLTSTAADNNKTLTVADYQRMLSGGITTTTSSGSSGASKASSVSSSSSSSAGGKLPIAVVC